MARFPRLFLPFVILLAGMMFACKDEDGDGNGNGDSTTQELSLSEYMARVETIFAGASDRTETINQTLDDDLAAAEEFDEQLDAFQTFVSDTQDLFDDSIAEMDGLAPPVEAEQPHNDFVDASSLVATAVTELDVALGEAEDEADVSAALDDFETSIAEPLFSIDEACADLQDVADDNDIDADLSCTERVFPERPQDPS